MEKETLEQISSQVKALYNLIVSVNIGLKAEKTEAHITDSLDCIAICTKAIKQFVDSKLQ